MANERVSKSLMNAKVNLLIYFISLFLAFFSRKIFLDCLGASFIGLEGTLFNILGYLNLAELGIGVCVNFYLFKPIQSEDHKAIQEILSIFGYFYKKVAYFLMATSVIISLFFPLIFSKETQPGGLGLPIIYVTFFSFVGSSLIGYLINYRQILLSADQKNYVISLYFQGTDLFKTVIQIVLAYYYKNLFIWVGIEFLFSVISCILLNIKIKKEYPWLNCDKSKGKALLKSYPGMITNVKQIFIHNIKDFVLKKSDEILIFAFVSLQMVAYYGNYMLIINKVSALFTSMLDGVSSGVGNLVAEGNHWNTMKVFWELISVRYFCASFVIYSIYILIEPFISLWLGTKYVMDPSILILLLVNAYIVQSRGVVDIFNHAYGLYADVWSAWTELILNLTITISVGIFYGIIGLLLGKIISTFLIVVLWKPYYLFHSGLKEPIIKYWIGTLPFYATFAFAFFAGSLFNRILPFNPYSGYGSLIAYAICAVAFYTIILFITMLFFTKGIRDFCHRVPIIKKIV